MNDEATKTIADAAPTRTVSASSSEGPSQTFLGPADVDRAGRVQLVLMVIFGALAITLPIYGAHTTTLGRFTMASLVVGGLANGATFYVIRRKRTLPIGWMVGLSVPSWLAAVTGTYYVGFFSFGFATYVFTVYAMASLGPAWAARYAYLMSAVITAVPMGAITLGWLPDLGLLRPTANRLTLVMCALGAQLVLFFAYIHARDGRRRLQKAIDDMERALRDVAQREALLGEANLDLDRLLHAPATRPAKTRVGGWQLGELLGRGGMGEVYRALHDDGRHAAVKILPDDALDEPTLVERFRREAEALRALVHPNVVAVYEVGDDFIAMELLEGTDLAAMLRRRRALPMNEALALVKEVASALEAARSKSIVHRDIKPQNLFWAEASARWKVLDFGLSKLAGSSQAGLTRGVVVGTPTYMAPEQVNNERIDHRTDVFSLAVVAYRTITGSPAFTGGDHALVLLDVVSRQPAKPSDLALMALDVDLALALGLAKAPAERIETAAAFYDALESASRGALSPALRQRGSQLVAAMPWGQRLA